MKIIKNDIVPSETEDKANDLVKDYAFNTIAVGLVPFPLFDLIGLSALQTHMLSKIAKIYNIRFSENLAKALITPLLGSTFPILFTASLCKFLPGIGTTTGMLSTTVIAAPSTYAIGKIFIRHFETGGTFKNFNPKIFKKNFKVELQAARKLLAQSQTDKKDKQGHTHCNHKHSHHCTSEDTNSCQAHDNKTTCNHSSSDEHHDRGCCGHSHSFSAEETKRYKRNLKLSGTTLGWAGVQKIFFPSVAGITPIVFVFTGTVTVITGFGYLRGLWNSIKKRKTNTDTLVGTATVATLACGQGVTALSVIFLLNIGEYLQSRTLLANEKAIKSLLSTEDEDVWIAVPTEQGEIETNRHLNEVQLDDIVVVYAGKRIVVDGTVINGQGELNEAPVTGESHLTFKQTGEQVYAGTILLSGKIWVKAEKVSNDTVIGRIIERVTKAKESKPTIQTTGEKFSKYVVPASLGTAALVFLVTLDPSRALSMLLIACPCAIGLSTPTAINAATGNAAKKGVMIKGGAYIEKTAQADIIIFDKTGTLTSSAFELSNIISFSEDYTEEKIISLAAIAELHSEHPLAVALVNYANARKIDIPSHDVKMKILEGRGIETKWDKNVVLIGNHRLMEESNVFLSQNVLNHYQKHVQQGESVMYIVHQQHLVGLITMRNHIAQNVVNTLAELRASNDYRLLMITGDNEGAAKMTAKILGIEEWHAQLLPEEKYQFVRKLQTEGHKVIMVGDGINDAPALAIADVGIAIGTSRADITVESADIVIAGDNFNQLKEVIQLSDKTLSVIKQNYAMSLGVNLGGMGCAMIGLLNPFMAAIVHNASTVAVVVNSARMIRYQSDSKEMS